MRMAEKLSCAGLRLGAVAAVLLCSAPARAAVWRVPGDFFSMANAIADSVRVAPGDTIRVAGNGGSLYRERSVVTRSLRIEGGWRADFQVHDPSIYVTAVRDPANLFEFPLIRVENAAQVTIDGFTLIGGRRGIECTNSNVEIKRCEIRGQRHTESGNTLLNVPGAGVRVAGGSAVIEDVVIRDVLSDFGGAGVGIAAGANVTILDCRIENSTAAVISAIGPGAAISAVNAAGLRLERTNVLRGLTANNGGLFFARNTPVTMIDCSLSLGLASISAGAMILTQCPSVELVGCSIVDCVSNNRGGGMYVEDCGSLTMTNCSVLRNLGRIEGGGLYLVDTPFSFTDCHWEENARDEFPTALVTKGGGVRAVGSSGTATRCCFVNEVSSAWGGGWSNAGGDAQFVDCVFDGAFAKVYGGGLHSELSGTVSLLRTLFRGCEAKYGGALSASFTAGIALDRCTLVDNSAQIAGAALYLDTGAQAQVASSILGLASHGDLVHCSSATVAIAHSNVWNDDAVNGREEYGGTCGDPTGTDGNLSVDPQFCPLGEIPPFCDSGTSAYSLTANSPCVGSGLDGVDMGWRPAGCAATSAAHMELESWGRLKARYR
jgi:hypothetical protein